MNKTFVDRSESMDEIGMRFFCFLGKLISLSLSLALSPHTHVQMNVYIHMYIPYSRSPKPMSQRQVYIYSFPTSAFYINVRNHLLATQLMGFDQV